MNKLNRSKQVQVISALNEGNSIRATVRMTGVAKDTVTKLLVAMGTACARYHNAHVRNLKVHRVQCDEIWQFCYAKEKNVPAEKKGQFGYGDVWTWVGMDAETKLAISYLIGTRDSGCATEFISDLKDRLANRVQLTTDGYRVYLNAVEEAFGADIDYAMLVKIYGKSSNEETRYSPAECIGCQQQVISGSPDRKHISTSYVERQNLTVRMSMRRFTRLTNAFSKKIENLMAAVALHYMQYNFCRIHSTLRVTPAMEAGIADHVWSLEELVGILDAGIATHSAA
jgi:IS1 family transposase